MVAENVKKSKGVKVKDLVKEMFKKLDKKMQEKSKSGSCCCGDTSKDNSCCS